MDKWCGKERLRKETRQSTALQYQEECLLGTSPRRWSPSSVLDTRGAFLSSVLIFLLKQEDLQRILEGQSKSGEKLLQVPSFLVAFHLSDARLQLCCWKEDLRYPFQEEALAQIEMFKMYSSMKFQIKHDTNTRYSIKTASTFTIYVR